MKARPFRGTKVPNLAGKGPDDTITRAELVALIAGRIPRGVADDEADVRNRVSAKVSYHVNIPTPRRPGARPLPQTPSGRFRLGAVAAWATKEWPGCFNDLPKGWSFAGSLPALTGSGSNMPRTLEEAESAIHALRELVVTVKRELAAAESQVRELEPDAKKWRDWINHKRKQQV